MKKLFTLLAFLTCFLGANAVTKTDVEVDFSKFSDISEFSFFSWRGSASAMERLSIQDGCLHFESTEATDPSWDCQFFPIGGVETEVDVVYTLHFKIKGDHNGNVSMLGFGQTPYGQFPITTEWVEGTVDYTCVEVTEQDGRKHPGAGDILMQCGDWIGSWDIAYLKITHEEKEQAQVEWVNILENGDASGEFGEVPCAYSKEFGYNDNNPHPAFMEDGAFKTSAQIVDPVIVWESDGEQWGQPHSAGDPMPDNTWQNQFWINFPRPLKADEPVKLSFRYKASKDNIRVTTQDHRAPGDYLGGGKVGELTFSTEWQEYSKEFSAADGVQSIAFNFGEDKHYLEQIDFYFDDLNLSVMKLEEGFFIASTNTETGLVEYNFDEAVKCEYDESDGTYVGTVGTRGNQDSWVNEVMISTVRGNDKGFKSSTVKAAEAVKTGEAVNYSAASNAKIKLPAQGVWTVTIYPEYEQMIFEKVEGEADKEPIEIVPNPTVVVVHGLERDDLADADSDYDGVIDQIREEEGGEGQPWDNQFFIVANRPLETGEVTILKFDYVASVDAKTTTQCHAEPGAYLHWAAIGDVNFTTEEQSFETTFTVPSEASGMQSIAFNMAEIREACDYTIKNVIWQLEDGTESLINMEGAENFYVKEGAGTNPHIFGTDPDGINNVVSKSTVSNATYNLAGQRVSKDYKGIVIKNGKKVVVK